MLSLEKIVKKSNSEKWKDLVIKAHKQNAKSVKSKTRRLFHKEMSSQIHFSPSNKKRHVFGHKK